MTDLAKHWIGGSWVTSADGAEAESINPATSEVLGTFATGGKAEAEAAIAAARHAFESSNWAHQPQKRSAALLDFANRLEAAKSDLAQRLTAENGKLLKSAELEIIKAISETRYYAGLARNIFGRVTELDVNLYATLAREPIGVAAIIVPWNAPITLLVRSLAPALAAGCTVVVKAAPQTALVNAEVFKLLAACPGFPSGVINMVNEVDSEAAKTLVASTEVDVVSYTGSTEVGKRIMAGAAGTLKRLNLELGGNAPAVIFADANMDQTIPAVAQAGMVQSGQVCTAVSRVLVHASCLEEVRNGLQAILSDMVIGFGDDPKTQLGPMIDISSRDRILELVAEADKNGEILLCGSVPGGVLAQGAFIEPSLVSIHDPSSALLCQETFGPVLSIDTFENEEEAVQKANNTRYGLAASVWTSDLKQGQRVASRLKSGTVWINNHNRLFAEIEAGGYKESGFGRLHGVEGLDSFLQTKHISWST